MRTHTTQGEILRIQKLLRNGITEVEDIQKQVFIHASSIQKIVDLWKDQNKKTGKPKKKAVVDPLS